MGTTVSREHAKLPFGYTQARREDHTRITTTSSSQTSRRQRLAHRLFLTNNSGSTSITPLQPHHLHLAEEGGILLGGSISPTLGEGGVGLPTGELSHESHWNNDDADSDAEIVSLSSILNQGPEFELQWHAVGQNYDEGFYSCNTLDLVASGSGTRTTGHSGGARQGYDSSALHSRSTTLGPIDHSTYPQEPHRQSKTDRETATYPNIHSGVGSPTFQPSVTIKQNATMEIVDNSGNERKQCGATTNATIAAVSAATTTKLLASSPTQSDSFNYSSSGNSSSGQDEGKQKSPERPRIHLIQHLQRRSFKAIRQDLTDTEEETDEELTKSSEKRKMDIISALGIADVPDEWQEQTSFKFFKEEPMFHSISDQFRPQMTARRYTTDRCSYGHSKGLGAWMDHDYYEGVVHLPQGFFETHRHPFVDDEDGTDEEFDVDGGEVDGEVYLRARKFNKGKSASITIPGYSTATLGSAGHSLFNYPATMIAGEDVSHFSPIPFSELPSLTNIGLCSYGIVKLSSNIRLLTSATCLQVLCSVPVDIGFLRNLTLLDLSKNSLKVLPDSIRFLSKLMDLKLSFNYIESLPSAIGELAKLTLLRLDNNRITRIPSQINRLKNLTTLDLDNNPITVLPAEIGQLHFLKRLQLENCPLVSGFVHSPLQSPPTLLELAARVIVRKGVNVPSILPSHLKKYIKSSQPCSFCGGPYFESSFKRGRLIEKNNITVPLEYTLCTLHWNNDMERIKLLFGPRPITAPPLPPSKFNSAPTTSSTNMNGGNPTRQTKSDSNSSPTPSNSTGFEPTVQNSNNSSAEPTSSSRNNNRQKGFWARMRSKSKSVINGDSLTTITDGGQLSSSSSSPSISKSRFSIRLKSRGDQQQFSSQ
ncbi:Leucine-rich repeat-containing protein 63 [Entomortierella lignicola]|nr:Leucine-rich repeat-containing protein 63 [Entomortierella lignicola]